MVNVVVLVAETHQETPVVSVVGLISTWFGADPSPWVTVVLVALAVTVALPDLAVTPTVTETLLLVGSSALVTVIPGPLTRFSPPRCATWPPSSYQSTRPDDTLTTRAAMNATRTRVMARTLVELNSPSPGRPQESHRPAAP